MGLFSRITFNKQGDTFHSSGIAGGDENGMGATSAQSFEQRQQIEKSRKFVGGYQDANILHEYRNNAQADTPPKEHFTDKELEDREYKRHHKRSQTTPRTSKIEHRSTSRIENPSTSRVDSRTRLAPGTAVPSSRARTSMPRFNEPASRRFNPYK